MKIFIRILTLAFDDGTPFAWQVFLRVDDAPFPIEIESLVTVTAEREDMTWTVFTSLSWHEIKRVLEISVSSMRHADQLQQVLRGAVPRVAVDNVYTHIYVKGADGSFDYRWQYHDHGKPLATSLVGGEGEFSCK